MRRAIEAQRANTGNDYDGFFIVPRGWCNDARETSSRMASDGCDVFLDQQVTRAAEAKCNNEPYNESN
eukprot:91241-Pyramimonas_sp.AAC.1